MQNELMVNDNGESVEYKDEALKMISVYRNIAADGENATLKRFMKMGDSVLLMPENPSYEPIMLRNEDARIMGIAVGVLKRKEN